MKSLALRFGTPAGKEEGCDACYAREHPDDAARRCGSGTEGEGFEPPGPLPGRLLSRQLQSTGLCHPSEAALNPRP